MGPPEHVAVGAEPAHPVGQPDVEEQRGEPSDGVADAGSCSGSKQ